MRKTKRGLSTMVAATMAIAMTACGGGENSESAAGTDALSGEQAGEQGDSGEPIVVNVCESSGNSVVSLDFYRYSLHPEWQYAECCYDALLHADYAGNFEPEICTSYELAEDGLSAVLHLAENVKFQDGTDCNADDVVATLNYLAENKDTLAMISNVWKNLSGAEKIDDYTVKVNMDYKSHVFEIALGYTFILSDEDLANYGDQMWAQGVVNGTGPWKFEEWIDGQYVKFSRNDDYWQGVRTNVDELNIWYITEANTVVSSLISGEIDAVGKIENDLLPMIEGNEAFIMEPYNVDSLNYIQFKSGPGDSFEDINMRKAVAHAINYEALLNFYGGGQVLECAATPGNDGYVNTGGYTYDPELAKEYLAQTNYDGQELSLASWTSRQNECTAIAADLAAIGINVSLNLCDSAAFSALRSEGDYDMFYGGVATWDGDLMTQYLVPRIRDDCHNSGYVDEEINELLTQADAETDRETRKGMLEQVMTKMYESYGPIIGTIQTQATSCVRKGLEGINQTPGGNMFFRNVSVDESVWGK